jgi:hypothetical protein
MERYAYSLDGKIYVGSFESRDAAKRGALFDNRHVLEARTSVDVWTAIRGTSPRAGELVPSGERLLSLMKDQLGGGEAAAAWFAKLEGLPEETIERLRHRVVEAFEGWTGSLGLHPRFFSVEEPHKNSAFVIEGVKKAVG